MNKIMIAELPAWPTPEQVKEMAPSVMSIKLVCGLEARLQLACWLLDLCHPDSAKLSDEQDAFLTQMRTEGLYES